MRSSFSLLLLPIVVAVSGCASNEPSPAMKEWARQQIAEKQQLEAAQRTQAKSSVSINPQRDATITYWNSIVALDAQTREQFAELAKISKEQPPSGRTEALAKFVTGISTILNNYTEAATALPVQNVDERLVESVAEDLRRAANYCFHLQEMVSATNAYTAWSRRRKSHSADNFLGNLVDSLVMGAQGQPFAGYNQMREQISMLDAEGQKIANTYISHSEALSQLMRGNVDLKVKELELRSFLCRKYNTELAQRHP